MTPSDIPFKLFKHQEKFIRWLVAREAAKEDGLVEKSRDMGVTYLCCAYALHRWLFTSGAKIGFGSRKLELVDKLGDPDCIFEKIRFMLYRLPAEQLPRGFKRREHDNSNKLINPETGSVITGEGGDNIGRGGRASIYFVDESAHLEHPESIDRSLSQTTNCRIDVSTPNGPGNPFAQKRHGGKVPVFTFHWRDDERKDDDWYEREKNRLDPITLAQEIDIDYSASVEGVTIPAMWVRAAVDLQLECDDEKVIAGLDIADEGENDTVLLCRRGPFVTGIDCWSRTNTNETAWRAADICENRRVADLYYDGVGVGAGVRGAYASAERKLQFTPVSVNTGGKPTRTRWPDTQTSQDKFRNLKAEAWWLLRLRFEKAYEYVESGVEHPANEMISIPSDARLITELSLQRYEHTETGKIQMVSKRRMREAGIKSPDYADACVLAFCPKLKREAKVW